MLVANALRWFCHDAARLYLDVFTVLYRIKAMYNELPTLNMLGVLKINQDDKWRYFT
jgi:hypothetical protein